MLKQSKKVFFLGIKGVAMTNLAVFLKKMGKEVTGCDLEEVFITDALLDKNGISFDRGFDKFVGQDVDLVVYSAAHG
jgi:UDP-N-acetylmuramate-alanine ligase